MEKCFDAHCDAFDSAPEELKNEIKLPRSIKTAVAASCSKVWNTVTNGLVVKHVQRRQACRSCEPGPPARNVQLSMRVDVDKDYD